LANLESEKQIQALEVSLAEEQHASCEIRQKSVALGQELERTQGELAEQSDTLETTLNQMNGLREKNRSLEETHLQLEEALERLKADTEALNERLLLLQTENANMLANTQHLVQDFSAALEQESERFSESVAGNLTALGASVQDCVRKCAALGAGRKQQAADQHLAVLVFKQVVDELENDLVDFRQVLLSKALEADELGQENAILRQRNADWQQELRGARRELEGLAEERTSLCREIVELNAARLARPEQEAEEASFSPLAASTDEAPTPPAAAIFDPEMRAAVAEAPDGWQGAYQQLAAYYGQLQTAYSALYCQMEDWRQQRALAPPENSTAHPSPLPNEGALL